MKRALFILALMLAAPLPVTAQPALPGRVNSITEALYQRHKALAEGNDNQRRSLTKMIAEQVSCELGANWGWKSSTPSNPPSKDAIARHGGNPRTGPLDGWDLFNGSTRKPIPGGIYHDLTRPTRQHFIEVQKVDHLAVGCLAPVPPPPPPPPGPDPEPPPTDPASLAAILLEVRAVNEKLTLMLVQQAVRDAALTAAIAELQKQVASGVKIRF